MPISDNPSLEEILNNPVLKEAFMTYNATKQFEPEQVPFLLAAGEFRDLAEDPRVSVEDLSAKANKIAAQYIKVEGDGINIGTGNSKAVLAQVDKLNKMASGELPVGGRGDMQATFNIAEKEMNALIRTNGLPRFIKTDEFQVAKQTAQQVEKLEDRIKNLESKAEKLQTSKWAQFKAYFSGGADKAQQQIVADIDKAKMEIMQKTDPVRFETVQREKEKMAAKMGQKLEKLAPKVEQYQAMQEDPVMKNASIQAALETGGLGSMSVKEKMENDKVMAKLHGAEGAVRATKSIGQEKSELEKSVKVGDSLKGKIGVPSQGQSGPKVSKL